jgi:hypothetical protein
LAPVGLSVEPKAETIIFLPAALNLAFKVFYMASVVVPHPVVPKLPILAHKAAASAGVPLEIQKAKRIALYLLSGAIPGTAKELAIVLPQYELRPSIYVTYFGPDILKLFVLVEGTVVFVGIVVLVVVVVFVVVVVELVVVVGLTPGVPPLTNPLINY